MVVLLLDSSSGVQRLLGGTPIHSGSDHTNARMYCSILFHPRTIPPSSPAHNGVASAAYSGLATASNERAERVLTDAR